MPVISNMIPIIGLGNPGKKFIGTRHNLGFAALDGLKRKHQFRSWQEKKKLKAKISQGKIGRRKIILVKPQTGMNSSGRAVKRLTKYYHLNPKTLILVHDDLDLPLGKVKLSRGRGSAGHKGVQSIIDELGTNEFVRMRVGIKPTHGKWRVVNSKVGVADFVLEKFTTEEQKIVRQIKKRALAALEVTIEQGVKKATNEFPIRSPLKKFPSSLVRRIRASDSCPEP